MKHWWQDAVVYQVYPRSFQDSNHDGIGDIPGIIERLPYLEKLGIDAIWLSPVYASPNDDNGYDISDYQDIMPEFGTMADMDQLLKKSSEHQIKIIMDLVVNHTSDEHHWFQEAKKSRDNPYRNYYIWHDAVNGQAPNDLLSTFGGSAWTFDEATQQYYLHLFSKKQPDLNWENPKVRQEIYQMMNFWLAKGVGGFRMDVIDLIGKEPLKKITGNGPHLHEYLQEMNQATFGHSEVLTVGETWGATPEIAKLYSNPAGEELSMVFQFETEDVDRVFGDKWEIAPVDFAKLKNILAKWQTQLGDEGWNSLFWSNHDLPRVISRFGSEKFREKSGQALATVLHFLKGTPYIYQGEEIGMVNRKMTSLEEISDIEARNMAVDYAKRGWSQEKIITALNTKGRDTARSPMQWDESLHAGFSDATPWLSITQDYQKVNVKKALENPQSIFYTYQKLIALRKKYPVIVSGDFKLIETIPEIFAYWRTNEQEKILVVANLSENVQTFQLPKEIQAADLLISNTENITNQLQPYDAFAYLIHL
ncbi:glycoside hydrolase family 13 protein [Enterococcus timonensis]|uniref:glycoside hydrolase family 13 protein n=1 Tax=Enterococcus timonensis TaxID=1852364 RepID=UPI0008DABA28|nr:alpha-glucosidase [Enterococcus timonensis]